MPPTLVPVTDHLMRTAARVVGGSPDWVKRRIAGPPIRIDGQELHLEAQLGVRLLGLGVSTTFEDLPIAQGRKQISGEAFVFGSATPVATVQDLSIPGPGGDIPVRLYRPADVGDDSPAMVYLHGGGWVLGDLGSADAVCRFLAAHTPMTVVSVDYRLAPENPFPAGLDDAIAAYAWVVDNAVGLGVDPTRVAVGGESAGGNLAAVVALHTDDSRPRPAMQMLFNPVTDLSTRHRSYELFGEGFFLTARQMDWYQGHYLPDPALVTDPRVSPLLAQDVSHAPPAYVVVAGFDVLRDEGEAYAHKLAEAGVDVTLRRHRGLIHGLVNATGVGSAAKDALREAVGVLHTRLGRVAATDRTAR